jgi:NDP-sugar pyrophosphorylase family protein
MVMNIVIPMAGLGSRFQKVGVKAPKPLIEVLGKTLIEYSVKSFDVEGRFIFITREFDDPEHNKTLSALLKKLRPESIEIRTKTPTSGATETALLASTYIDNNDPLVIYNCDQYINWDSNLFLQWIEKKKPQAALVLYKSKDPKNSFAEVKLGRITRLVEKQAISDHALIGFHYWAQGKDFVKSANQLMETFRANGKPECYISETFNYLQNPKILPYHVADHVYVPLGTPEDVSRYVGKVKEFKTVKPKTLFIDIDGTILKHMHSISDVYTKPAEVLSGVVEKINEWDSHGHKIIFVTARKESTRTITESQLRGFGLAWDQLVMGVGGGTRLLINDKLTPQDPDRAIGINVITDGGFGNISWEDYDL